MEIPSPEELKRYEKLWIEDLTQQQGWSQHLSSPTTKEKLDEQILKVKETIKHIKCGGATAFVALEKDIIFKINELCITNGDKAHSTIYDILRAYIYDACDIKLNAKGNPIASNKKGIERCIEYERQVLRIGKNVVESREGRKFFTRADMELCEKLVGALV